MVVVQAAKLTSVPAAAGQCAVHRAWVWLLLGFASTLAGGCLPPGQPLVAERSTLPPAPVAVVMPKVHRVNRGETLYSIAWRYDLDFRYLAGVNQVPAPYIIRPGQVLRLTGALPVRPPEATPAYSAAEPPEPAIVAKRPDTTRPSTASASGKGAVRAPAGGNTRKNKPAGGAPTPSKPATRKPATATARTAATQSLPVGQWLWPVNGKPVRELRGGNRGLDFELQSPARITAIAPGAVVYAGNGLAGFVHLVIVKHNARYLSAYGMDLPLRVREGQIVKAGALLADIKEQGRAVTKLHFEVRRDGEPVSPRSVLQ